MKDGAHSRGALITTYLLQGGAHSRGALFRGNTVYKEPKSPISMEGEGVADLLKKDLKKARELLKHRL